VINGGLTPIQSKPETLDKLVKEFAINHLLFPKEITEQLIEINSQDGSQTKKITKFIDLVSSNQKCTYQIRNDSLVFLNSFEKIEELESIFEKFFKSFSDLTPYINYKQSKRLGLVLIREDYNEVTLREYCTSEELDRNVIENRSRKVTRFAMAELNEMVNLSVSKDYVTHESGVSRNTLASVYDVNTLSTKDVFRFTSKDVVKFINASKKFILESM
ncbi:hypothetical protein RFZ03_00125, partial [Acinetobacter baumannii]